MRVTRRAAAAATAAAMLLLAACAESDRDGDDDDAAADSNATLVFGTEGEIKTLDPSFASDGVTMRVGRQIFDTLVMLEPGTVNVVGGLAESWESDETGTVWTFNLRQGVTFHDGTEFNAEAVCFNFDRWHNMAPGLGQDPDMTYYWQVFSGGFAENTPDRDDLDEPNYVSCEPTDPQTAVITLANPTAKMPGLLVLPCFAIHSPTALQEFDADAVSGEAAAPVWPAYSTEHPTGTGPFKFESWDQAAQEVTLVRNDDYWGDPATIGRLVFRAIPDENARRQALVGGEIQGYDLPSPADWEALEAEGMNLEVRDPVNLLYLAFTQEANPALEDVRVRQAIAHALDRQGMIDAVMPEGAEVATQFSPPSLQGWSQDVPTYDYDPQAARDLLAEAGFEEGELEVDFYSPTDVTRPYMPNPQAIFELFVGDLEEVGIVVNQQQLTWTPEYLAAAQNGEADLHFLGWTADYPDTYNFIGTWFANYSPQWGFRDEAFFGRMAEAEQEPDAEARYALYEQLNAEIMEFLPGVPISHSPPAIVFAPNVTGVPASPLQDERMNTAQVASS
jgi:peptide/nickel transport system substrate-binding protein